LNAEERKNTGKITLWLAYMPRVRGALTTLLHYRLKYDVFVLVRIKKLAVIVVGGL